ncbi:hypothetical protein C6A87_000845 [Mycobacterium sp. ITM-2016-00317]|uniref:hypothetical protein n=1 Tax=Mycobacterium sp. ITM-2016-00317 TaxID=2099694 RepID=UPI00287F9766|nr:hypothetical protein [Mycobacterium sp. ITM-2016-00317]WNG87871.1 hypothetical protein C6A87_000845 [Mycobacterium sp. ITM-2016-00317]
MSRVVERGLARCPRCVAVADYVFIESERNVVRYEVRCRKCGGCYGEDSRPGVPGTVGADEASIQWPPDCEPAPPRDWRAEVREKLAGAAQRGRTEFEVMNKRAHGLVENGRTWVNERRSARAGDQTGG